MMSNFDQRFRMILRGALVVLMGILAGEVFAPAPVQAGECGFSKCTNEGNCMVSLVAETCDLDGGGCMTVACEEDDDPIRE